MSNKSTTFRKYDRNRYRKIYPINRFPTSNSFRSNAEVIMESVTLTFSKQDSKSGALKEKYSGIPTIALGSSSTGSAGASNVNLFISSIAIDLAGVVTFTVSASAEFTGTVAIQVLSIS